jgi:hypothetical protein
MNGERRRGGLENIGKQHSVLTKIESKAITRNFLHYEVLRGTSGGFGEVAEWLKAPHSKCHRFRPQAIDYVDFLFCNGVQRDH